MKLKRHFHKPVLDHKLAIKLSVAINLVLGSFVFIGIIFSEKIPDDLPKIQELVKSHSSRFLVGVLSSFLLFEYCFWIFRTNWKVHKKISFALCGTITLTLLISPVFTTFEIQFFQNLPADFHNRFIIISLIYDLIKSLIIYLVTQIIAIAIRNQEVLLENQRILFENQRLGVENIKNRYEALKNQLNPHFLFNTLNTLDGLIGYDDEKAHAYLQNLTSSFRYAIQNKKVTTLKEELKFAEAFTYLMKIRYGDNLNIQYAIDEKYNAFYIMPLTLQLLIENAIKHNVIDDERPLQINIETTENETIKVCNTIQPKIDVDAGENVGLTNLVERYRLMFSVDVFIENNGVWSVEIPLIKELRIENKIPRNDMITGINNCRGEPVCSPNKESITPKG